MHEFDKGDEPAGDAGPGTAGDISYVSLLVPDGDAARAFYGAVLGWLFEAGSPTGTTPMVGMWSGVPPAGDPFHQGYGAILGYTVHDIAAVVLAVRAAGGTAGAPAARPYALSADCVDDQGIPFYLHQYPTT